MEQVLRRTGPLQVSRCRTRVHLCGQDVSHSPGAALLCAVFWLASLRLTRSHTSSIRHTVGTPLVLVGSSAASVATGVGPM